MKSLFIGQQLVYLNTVDSTNSYATELLRTKSPLEGTIIYSFDQTKGRGQRGNKWETIPNDNVALSIIIHPKQISTNEQFILSKITALALTDLMAESLCFSDKTGQVSIKWPNDIYIGKKKIAGILIENALSGNQIKNSIIGIGININQTEFPSQLNATSMALIGQKNFNLEEVVLQLAKKFEIRYLQLKANKTQQINTDYLNLLFQKDEWHSYSRNQEEIKGKIKGVSNDGKLLLENKSGDVLSFNLQEITFLL